MNLKTGDKVLLKPLYECQNRGGWVEPMNRFAGRVVTVVVVGDIWFTIEEDDGQWIYPNGAIDYVIFTKKIDADPESTPKDTFELLFGFTD